MGCHVVFSVEFFTAHCARIGFSVQMSGDIMAVEIGRVGIRIVTNFTTVGVALLRTIGSNTNGGTIATISRG